MTEKEAMAVVYSILEKKQGLTTRGSVLYLGKWYMNSIQNRVMMQKYQTIIEENYNALQTKV